MRSPDPARSLFTWPDGVFSYECRGCGACCKGLGIGVDAAAGELDRLVEAYPEISGFARLRGATWTLFNPRDRCWFLDDVGMCRVETEHGRDAKPASCRLFPFNRVFRVGDWFVCDYNAVICPMRVLPPAATEVGLSGRVSHASVLEEIAAIEDAAIVGTTLPLDPDEDADALMSGERAIAEVCFESLAGLDAGQRSEDDVVEAISSVQQAVVAAGSRLDVGAPQVALAALTGAPARSPSGDSLRHAIAATPSLRFNELFGRRLYHGRGAMHAALPGMWRTWLHLLADGEAIAGRALSLQEVTSVWGEVAALGYLAAHWTTPAVLTTDRVEIPPAGPARDRVLAFARACHNQQPPVLALGELAEPLLRADTVHERIALVRLAEPLLAHLRFGDPEATPTTTSSRTSRTSRKKRRRR